ncbi:hypothetical protein ANN_16250 [Periplaneta americana]|uniref:AP-3 complex subunit beta C-terminal domain-containing protein n=1 Tax=Periplaneta americana TaxID=6978 RepID=A0ABQ8SII4_PERAM|nr:hypothetical protein ANN_16250 [Periplaneta americana]
MNDMIDNPVDCEVRSVIRFLNARHLKPAEIYRQLKEVYGHTVMNERNVRKWCEMFNNGRTNVHDETRPGRPSLITEDLKTKVNDRILQDRHTSFDKLHIAFPDISRSLLGEIVSQHLGYHKICARWVPRQLNDQHKTRRMASALTFLMRYHTDGDAFLDQIVTGDETWVSHNTPETKRQSRQWHHPSSPKKPRKFKQTLSTQKVMATVFWDCKGVLLLDFMPKGTTINANRYCETLRKLRRAIQNKRRGMLSREVVLLHDNARPHTAASTRELLDQFDWEIFDHPPYSPDLAPSDFHLFTKLKDFLGGTRFGSDEELKKTVNTWLNELAAEEYHTGILKLVNRYDKCLNEDIVKLQILNLAVKLYLTNPKQTKLLCQYVFSLARYDQNYDIRDRARFLRQFIFPTNGVENSKLAKHAKKMFLATKPAPVLESKFKDSDEDSSEEEGTTEEEGSSEEEEDSSREEESDSESSESHNSTDEKGTKANAKPKKSESKKPTTKEPSHESTEESESDEEEDSSEEEASDSSESSADKKKATSKKGSAKSSSFNESSTQESKPKSNLDLLLELDDVPPTMTPVLTPSLGGFLTPLSTPVMPITSNSIQPASPSFIPLKTTELLNKISGRGLSVLSRFTRSPHLFSPAMVSIELTFTNLGTEDLADIKVSQKSLPSGMSMHDFAPISVLPVNAVLPGTIGVDFNDSTQPVSFTISVGGVQSNQATLKAPVGELIRAVTMPEPLFITEQISAYDPLYLNIVYHLSSSVLNSSPIHQSFQCIFQ